MRLDITQSGTVLTPEQMSDRSQQPKSDIRDVPMLFQRSEYLGHEHRRESFAVNE
jgi:hypothetical protein